MDAAGLTAKGFVRGANGEWFKPARGTVLPADRARTLAELERDSRDAALVKAQAQRLDTGKFLVRVTSVRKFLLDEDNLCEKYAVDCLRYSGIIPSDGPRKTKIEVCQRKADKGEAEHVIIEVFQIP